MKRQDLELKRPDVILKGSVWLPENPKRYLVLEHGMAEHHRRYDDFAAFLAASGTATIAFDLRGHGLTAGPPGSPEFAKNSGWFAEEDGWNAVVNDLIAVLDFAKTEAKGLPLFLMGHSLGSFLVRASLTLPSIADFHLSGVVLSGTIGPLGFIGAIGKLVASLFVRLYGPRAPSPFLSKMAAGSYAAKATGEKRPRTVFDWISSDPAVVDAYFADPYCGFVMTTSFYRDLAYGSSGLFGSAHKASFPRDIPILMFSGERDPVGGMGIGVRIVEAAYRAWGVRDVELHLYPGGRHEMINEIEKQRVYDLVAGWIGKRA